MSAEELVDHFNDGEFEEEIRPYFNDALSFLKYAYKYGFVTQLDLNQIPYSDFKNCLEFLEQIDLVGNLDYEDVEEEFKNTILLYQLEKDTENTLNYICDNLISDVYFINGDYHILLRDREELAELFEDGGRNTTSRDAAKAVLSEDMWDPFWDTTDNVYRDVIEDLNETNINNLAHYIVKKIGNTDLPLEHHNNKLFHKFSEEQETEDFFQITSENVMEFIKSEGAMKEMLRKDLDELNSDLYNIHNNAYNSSYESEIYNDVWSELERYFYKEFTYNEELINGKKKTFEYLKIKHFYQVVYNFLANNEGGTYSDSFLDYFGGYIGVIKSLMNDGVYDYLSFRIPDHADWGLTKKYINEIFPDYI
jgi:hypothetical protein